MDEKYGHYNDDTEKKNRLGMNVVFGKIAQLGTQSGAGVARSNVNGLNSCVLRQAPSDRVFTTAAANNENFHGNSSE